MRRNVWWCAAIMAALVGVGSAQTNLSVSSPWAIEQSGTSAGLRGIHAVSAKVAWASGTGGTILRTLDGGATWRRCAVPPHAATLDFRGIWAWDAQTAIAMSSGPGDQSRLYRTTDGCRGWKLLFTNPDQAGFWDAVVFQSRQRGYLLGDPVGGSFAFFTTTDGGRTWKRSQSAGLKAAPGATGAFAASNSALLGAGREPVAFGTGGAFFYAQSFSGSLDLSAKPGAPVKMTEQWTRTPVPLADTGAAAGIFSLGWREGEVRGYGFTLVAVGGDYTRPNDATGTAAWSADGGRTWHAAAQPPHGYRSAVAWDAAARAWIAAGTNGSDISYDDGNKWLPLDNGSWNALSLPWVVGPQGRIAKIDLRKLKP